MTRETKAGLVVSCSFLLLVGLVFYIKVNGPGNSSADGRAEDASVEAPDAPVPITAITTGDDNQTITTPTDFQPGNRLENQSATLVSAPRENEKSTIDNASPAGHGNQGNESSHHDNAAENSQPSSYQMPTKEEAESNLASSSNSSTEFSSSETSAKEKEGKDAGNGVNLNPIQESQEHKEISKASLSLTLDEQTKQSLKNAATDVPNQAKAEGSSTKEPPGTFNQKISESAIPPVHNEASGKSGNSGLDLEPPPIPSKYKHTLPDDLPKATAQPVPPASQAPGKFGRDPGMKKTASAAVEASGIKLHVPETVPGTPPPRSGGQIQGLTPGVMPSPVLTPPPAGDTAPEPHVQLGRPTPVPSPAKQLSQGPRGEQQNVPAGLSMAANPLTSPANPPATKPGIVPRVESYDEETYICKPGDTFASISTHYYYTDKYYLALLRFNRNHPRAAVGISQEPPVLQAGQPVYIPPLRILEKQYLFIPAEANAITQVGAASPLGSDPRNAATVPPVTIPPGKSWSTPSAEQTYQVPEKGEMFLEIARKTLGSPDRWAEIYRLNPRYDPKYPVPAGTTLRLPPDARVPVAEKKPLPISPEPKAEGGTPDPLR